MKKIISVAVCALLIAPAFAAPQRMGNRYAVKSHSVRSADAGSWYGTIRGEMSLLNWKNKYSSDVVDLDGKSENFSFESVFGGSLAIGNMATADWRGELEAGIIGQFTDSGYGADFKLTIPYLSVNVIYDFENNVYVGGGLGVALPKAELAWHTFDSDDRIVSPKFDLMVGYSHKLAERVSLDFRYRLSLMFGPDVKASGISDTGEYWLKTNINSIFSNSFSVGLRYEF